MNSGGFRADPEHQVTRVIGGETDAVRRRLLAALERFRYVVLSENPIQAKRPAQKSMWVAEILEYEVRLTVLLKPVSPSSTAATFDYAVPYIFTKGDRRTLASEAEAIVALANASVNPTVCPSCGADGTDDARFCRSCGAPSVGSQPPAELEVMRLTAGASTAQQEITPGLVISLLTFAVTLPMILGSDGKAENIGWVLLALGAPLALWWLQLRARSAVRLSKDTDPVER